MMISSQPDVQLPLSNGCKVEREEPVLIAPQSEGVVQMQNQSSSLVHDKALEESPTTGLENAVKLISVSSSSSCNSHSHSPLSPSYSHVSSSLSGNESDRVSTLNEQGRLILLSSAPADSSLSTTLPSAENTIDKERVVYESNGAAPVTLEIFQADPSTPSRSNRSTEQRERCRASPAVEAGFITPSTATSEPAAAKAFITVGPIIGLTTDSSVRVLMEANQTRDIRVQCHLKRRHVRLTNSGATSAQLKEMVSPGTESIGVTSEGHAANNEPKCKASAGTDLGADAQQLSAVSSPTTSSPASQPSIYENQQIELSQKTASNCGSLRIFEKILSSIAHRIAVVTFCNLEEDSYYELVCPEVTFRNVPISSFNTLLPSWPTNSQCPFRYAVLSCNLLNITRALPDPSKDLWLNLQQRVERGEVDYLLHMGDQIYADDKRTSNDKEEKAIGAPYQMVFKLCVEMLSQLPSEQWPIAAVHIKELYRQLYRETWSHAPTAFVMANLPNLMIADDHDFRDDFGCHSTDSDPSTKEYFVGRCAHAILCEYQRQLWDNVDFDHLSDIKRDFHFHVFGQHGLVFLDLRMPLSLHKIPNDPYPYLGSYQWTEVKAALSEKGIMRHVRSLLMICPAPVVFLPTFINDLLGNTVIDDALGHWSSAPYKAEQIMMLELCKQWKEARPHRELTFLGGDVHVGGNTEIMLNERVVFQQFISSAIANHQLSSVEFMLGKGAQSLITTLDNGWSFKHRGFTRSFNYGLLVVSEDEKGVFVKHKHITPEGELEWLDNRVGLSLLTS